MSSPLGPGRPRLYRVNKGSIKDHFLLTLTCRGGGGGLQTLSAHCGRYLNSAGDMVGSQDWGPPAPSRHAGPLVRLARPGEPSWACCRTSVSLRLQTPDRPHVPPWQELGPGPVFTDPVSPSLITTSINTAEGPLPLLSSRTPRNQVRGPGVPCPPSGEDPATHCCSLWMSPPQRGPLDTKEA